jgi:tRNA 2-thiocytidine biosynthesis protein TtcA
MSVMEAAPYLKERDKPRKKSETAISKKVGRAIGDYGMISDGDRILVAVSGGKDSLTLFKMLSQRRSFVPIRYDLVALHVDLGYHCAHQDVLKRFFEDEGYDLVIKKIDLLKDKARHEITCFWCSWNRRKALFEAAQEIGCNKIALGHHKDDIVQTILMNLLFEGQISAMAPKQDLFEGKVAIIRPLAYVEEKEIEEWVRLSGFPLPHCTCPNAATSKRLVVKKFLNELQAISPGIKTNVFKSLQNIKKDYLL